MAGTLKYSDALANFLLSGGSLKEALDGGRIEIYSGAQPANADAAVTGNLLAAITDAGGAITAEVAALGNQAFSSGAAGDTIDTLTVDGYNVMESVVTWITNLTTTLALVATSINQSKKNKWVTATSDATKVYLKAKPGIGTLLNGKAVTATCTDNGGGLTVGSSVNMGAATAGVDSVNGLELGVALAQVIGKKVGQVWSGTAVGAGTQTAGYFRFFAALADNGTDTGSVFKRLDGNIATSGATMNMSNTSIVNGAVQTITSVALTQPEA